MSFQERNLRRSRNCCLSWDNRDQASFNLGMDAITSIVEMEDWIHLVTFCGYLDSCVPNFIK